MDKIFNISNDTYDKLKWFVTIGFPALITFCAGAFELFEFAPGMKIVALMSLLNTMFGAWLGVSSVKYWQKQEK